MNAHVTPQHLSCPFCLFPFDAVARLEQFGSEAPFVVASVGMDYESGPRNRRRRPYRTADFVAAATADRMDRLREIFRLDREMFGYE